MVPFTELDKMILKSILKNQAEKNSQNNSE